MVDAVSETSSADMFLLQSRAAAATEAQRSTNTEGQSDAALFQAEIDKQREAAAAAANTTTSSADVFMLQSRQAAADASTAPLSLRDAPTEAGNSPIGTASASAGTGQQALSSPGADEQPTGFQIGAMAGGKPEERGYSASVHGILDTASYVPFAGTAFAIADAAVYAVEGKLVEAGGALVGGIPGIKQAKAVRLVGKAVVATMSAEGSSGTDKPVKTEAGENSSSEAPNPPLPKYPSNDVDPPGPEWGWRGKPGSKPGDSEGAWFNPTTRETLRSDLQHPEPIGPHWDYRAPDGTWYRWFQDGRIIKK